MTQEVQNTILLLTVWAPPGIVVLSLMLARVMKDGGRVHTANTGLPDLFMGFFLAGFFCLSVFLSKGVGNETTARVMTAKEVVTNSIFSLTLLALVVGFLKARRISVVEFFGLRRMATWRVGLFGPLLVIAAFPLLGLISFAVQAIMQGQARKQEVVTFFENAVAANQHWSVVAMFIMAAVVAPIMEETIFRGYFYPVFKGWAGAIASALFTSALFGAVHNSVTVFPALFAFALILTLAYEWSGSILLPIVMHSVFNGTQLWLELVKLKTHAQ